MAKPKVNPPQPAPTATKTWRRSLYHPKIVGGLVLLCLLPMLVKMLKRSEGMLEEQPQFQVQSSALTLKNRPEYVPEELLNRAWQRAGLAEQFSILEPGLAEKIGKALEGSPWVKQVKRIELKTPAQVVIELEYRRPVALVRSAHGYYPLDRDGILLPPMDFSADQIPLYPIIENVQTLPQGPAGTHWGDLGVWGAARLVDLLVPDGDLEKYWKKYDLKCVQVNGQADLEGSTTEEMLKINYRLITNQGSEVIWGVAPDVPDPTEPNAETKLKRLEIYYRDFGNLQSENGPVEIDLRRWKDIARRPLSLPNEDLLRR